MRYNEPNDMMVEYDMILINTLKEQSNQAYVQKRKLCQLSPVYAVWKVGLITQRRTCLTNNL